MPLNHSVVSHGDGFVVSPDDTATDMGKLMSNFGPLLDADRPAWSIDLVAPQAERTIVVPDCATDALRAAALRQIYLTAKALTPTAASRITIVLPAGRYDFETGGTQTDVAGANHGLVIDHDYIDLVGEGMDRTILTSSSPASDAGTLEVQMAGDFSLNLSHLTVYYRDGTAGAAAFQVSNDRKHTGTFLSVRFASPVGVPMRTGELAGRYERCECGTPGLLYADGSGGFAGSAIASGTFIDCIGGIGCFAGANNPGQATGIFLRCTAGDYSFGFYGGGAACCSGTFIDCEAGGGSFTGNCTGTFLRCKAGTNSFGFGGSSGGTPYHSDGGRFVDCLGGDGCFGGAASGSYLRCRAGASSFGGSGAAVSGRFVDCEAGDYSFGNNVVVTGYFLRCIAGTYSFGHSGYVSGVFVDCIAAGSSFDGYNSGGYLQCLVGGGMGFGVASAGGTYQDCLGGQYCFNDPAAVVVRSNAGANSFNGQVGHYQATMDAIEYTLP